MSRYIDAELANIYLNKYACKQINKIPTAENVVEIKDCNECKYCERNVDEYPCNMCSNCYTDKFKPKVYCADCEYLMYSDCYGECSKGHKGVVKPEDSCFYGKRKED